MTTPALAIQKKRDGEELSRQELKEFISGISNGNVTDYQATAFLMAVFFQGMTLNETVALTETMLESGERYDLSDLSGFKSDKHSTGGVGDKVSLILAPLAAACGLMVPMMSGRGLGHSGGTLDKLESITGFNVNLTESEFRRQLKSTGCAMIGQTAEIAPADKKLYALRDVTATVECIPLIVASILSKKLAEGTESLVLDVKVGSGAFMKNPSKARLLGKTLTKVAKKLGLPCRAIITNMNQPLGYSVGNALEVCEAVEVLKGSRCSNMEVTSSDLKELTIELCAQMLSLSGVSKGMAQGRKLARLKLQDGSAWKLFERMVEEQGGDVKQVRDTFRLPHTKYAFTWNAQKQGWLGKMDTMVIGNLLTEMGGGRKKAEDTIDYSVGFAFHRKLGAPIEKGDPICTVFAPEPQESEKMKALEKRFLASVEIGRSRKTVPKLILDRIT